MKQDYLKKILTELTESLPAHVKSIKKDVQQNSQRILNTAFSKLDLVTRKEYDVQAKVLARTRKKLEDLEKLVKNLEKRKKTKAK